MSDDSGSAGSGSAPPQPPPPNTQHASNIPEAIDPALSGVNDSQNQSPSHDPPPVSMHRRGEGAEGPRPITGLQPPPPPPPPALQYAFAGGPSFFPYPPPPHHYLGHPIMGSTSGHQVEGEVDQNGETSPPEGDQINEEGANGTTQDSSGSMMGPPYMHHPHVPYMLPASMHQPHTMAPVSYFPSPPTIVRGKRTGPGRKVTPVTKDVPMALADQTPDHLFDEVYEWEVPPTDSEPGSGPSLPTVVRFKCKICAHTFLKKHTVLTHIKTHLGNKPFICTIEGCGMSFVREHDRKRHELTHSGARPHACGCGKQFSRLDALRRHALYGKCPLREPPTFIPGPAPNHHAAYGIPPPQHILSPMEMDAPQDGDVQPLQDADEEEVEIPPEDVQPEPSPHPPSPNTRKRKAPATVKFSPKKKKSIRRKGMRKSKAHLSDSEDNQEEIDDDEEDELDEQQDVEAVDLGEETGLAPPGNKEDPPSSFMFSIPGVHSATGSGTTRRQRSSRSGAQSSMTAPAASTTSRRKSNRGRKSSSAVLDYANMTNAEEEHPSAFKLKPLNADSVNQGSGSTSSSDGPAPPIVTPAVALAKSQPSSTSTPRVDELLLGPEAEENENAAAESALPTVSVR